MEILRGGADHNDSSWQEFFSSQVIDFSGFRYFGKKELVA
jgi:hypothetical protein